jgi:hypothetical protein
MKKITKKITEKKAVKKPVDKKVKAAHIAAGRVFKYSQFSEPADSRIQVKMPEALRHHFVLAARMEKKSLAYVIVELLREKYGEPKKSKKQKTTAVKKPAAAAVKPDIDGLFGSEETEL